MKHLEEQHHEQLQDALQRLSEYEAPTAVWTNLEAMLREAPLQKALPMMPEYDAPPTIWEGIRKNLGPEKRPGLYVGFGAKQLKMLAIAASIALLFIVGWQWLQPSYELRFSQELVDNRLLELWRENDESALVWLDNLCRQEQIVCHEPRFKALKIELEELNEAEKKLRSAVGPYAGDPELAEELVRLEQAQKDIVQQLITLI